MAKTAAVRKFVKMTRDERFVHMATANRVTVGTITQLVDGKLKTSFVAKVRGVIVSDNGEWKFETPEEAQKFGRGLLEHWKREYYSGAKQEGQQ